MRQGIVLSFVFILLMMTLVVRKKLRIDFMPKAYSAVGDAGTAVTPLAPPIGQPLPTTPPANPPANVSTDTSASPPPPSNMPIPADPPTDAKTQTADTVVKGTPDPLPPPDAAPLPPAGAQQNIPQSGDLSSLPPSANAEVQRAALRAAQQKSSRSASPVLTSPITTPVLANPTPQELDPSIKFVDSGFSYDPNTGDKRNFFQPYFIIDQGESSNQPSGTPAPESNTVGLSFLQPSLESMLPESLEAADVSKFRLLGILWEVNDPKAMVVSPGGKTYILHKQTRIGRNNGYVAAIREGEVVVVEVSVDGKTPTTRVLSLQK